MVCLRLECTSVFLFISFGLLTAQTNVCPPDSENITQRAFGWFNNRAYLQQGIWYTIACPTFRPGEKLDNVVWRKRPNAEHPTTVSLIGRDFHNPNNNYADSDRYDLGPDVSLLIKGVEPGDEGDTFPPSSGESSTTSFLQGRRQTLPCQCASHPNASSVVYWSMGEGITTDTEIIGARFSDGATLQIQHGADYSIGSDASLTVNSLNDVHDNQRFWCHVFQSNETLKNCYTDVEKTVAADVRRPTDDALEASEKAFYLQKGRRQVLPCTNWTPGTATCAVQWLKIDTTYQAILNYTLSTNRVEVVTGYKLASNFGLDIASANDSHAGRYQCISANSNKVEEIQVRVTGDRFPLDGGRATAGEAVYFESDRKLTLTCPADFKISWTTEALIIWSYGKPTEENTAVIGQLSLPDGTKTLSDLKDKGCLGITSEGSLILNNCSQDGDVRYWCHVFQYKEGVIRAYVDSRIKDTEVSDRNPGSPYIIPVVIGVCVFVIAHALLIFVLVVRKRWKQSAKYKRAKQEPVRHYDVSKIAERIKTFVKKTFGRVPITPRTAQTDGDKAPMDKVYIPTEMFVNVPFADGCVRCKLLSESQLLDDGISELANRHVLISGKSGCGKTTILGRVIYDWSLGRKDTLLAEKKLVFLLPAGLLTQTRNLGQAVVQHMLPSHPATLATFINEYCSNNPSDVAILVDGCNGKQDIATVMRISEDQGLLECHLIMTTRNAKIAQDACKQYNMRSITISGFAPDNVCKYVENIIHIIRDKSNNRNTKQRDTTIDIDDSHPSTSLDSLHEITGEEKAEISPTLQLSPDESYKKRQGETPTRTTSAIHSGSIIESSSTVSKDMPKAISTEKDRISPNYNLGKYLEEGILPPEVVCLPGNLAALCQLCVWTNGGAFHSANTMSDIFYELVKCLFERGKVTNGDKSVKNNESMGRKEDEEASIGIGSRLETLTKRQLHIVTELGKVVQSKIAEHYEGPLALSESDFLNTDQGNSVLEAAIEMGMLCHVEDRNWNFDMNAMKVDSDSEYPKQVSKSSKIRSFLSRKQRVLNEPEIPLIKCDRKVHFILEILEHFCVGVYMAHSTEGVGKWLEDVSRVIGIEDSLDKISSFINFACREGKPGDRSAVFEQLVKIVNTGRKKSSLLEDVHLVQKCQELCMQLHFDCKLLGSMNKMLNELFPLGTVRLLGISRRKIRLLTYLLKHAQNTGDGSALNVKTIELFRIVRTEWPGFREILGLMATGKDGKTSQIEAGEPNKEADQIVTFANPQHTVAGTEQEGRIPPAGIPEVIIKPSSQEELKHNLEQPDSTKEADDPVTRMTPEEEKTQSKSYKSEEAHLEPLVNYYKRDTLKRLREKVESSSQDMPVFPSHQSDISVLQTVQSMGLQELAESQFGECHSSDAVKDLVRCLPDVTMLESLVLVGTILSSENICFLARNLGRLPKLQTFDLRLNKLFDDCAFEALTDSLHASKQLKDLRLSLYKVSIEGFNNVKKKMEIGGGPAWERLKTLYLLHASHAETFVEFFSNSVKYLRDIESIHISVSSPGYILSDRVVLETKQNLENQEYVTHLESVDIDNIEKLKFQLASLKLPKAKRKKEAWYSSNH
ncbi:uncharacterized protein LOC110975520 isoform X2 [Acanthaster planci]|uniref:Uncharacterized protein LOC110975520 isoform X2 n=1 Tax=Acanthaster planci TaxID=133434 RepID=A0A8B7XUR5_ACAPL|nr:uncharacterized protein LOC110975520 isoform X2 [Acanthaster planci]